MRRSAGRGQLRVAVTLGGLVRPRHPRPGAVKHSPLVLLAGIKAARLESGKVAAVKA